jgi:hypothetical protein
MELLWPPQQIAFNEQYGNAILMFAPIERCFGHSLAEVECDDGQLWPRPPLNRLAVSQHNAFYRRRLADWRRVFTGDSFDFDYHLMWFVWQQMTDTAVARVLYEDLQHLKSLGLNGLISCQAFRAFYPSGLAMAVLSEALWNPDVPWEELRSRYLAAAYGPYAGFAGDYYDQVEGFLDTGDPHRRILPLSNASTEKLVACAAFLEDTLKLAAQHKPTQDRVRARSLDLLRHHARLLQYVTKAYQARAAGEVARGAREFDRASEFLCRTERRYSTWIDAQLCLRLSVDAHRQ